MSEVPIEISAHHAHISKEDLEILFGGGYELKPIKDLSQKEQFASDETVDVKTHKGELKKLRILGPVRGMTQVEMSRTDAYILGIDPPVKECTSCVGEESEEVTVIGPKGEIKRKCAIIAHRHIHSSPKEAKGLGLKEGDLISVRAEGSRPVTFHQVLIRTDPTFVLRMHIDTDEANAAGIQKDGVGRIIK